MWRAPQGVHDFLRAYYHHKSADWEENRPYRLAGWTATEVAKMPTYYIMDLDMTMAETVAREMPTAAEIAANTWLPERELSVYSEEFGRTGFQGGLQWYRSGVFSEESRTFAGRTIDIPSMFIAGTSDWGAYQRPGSLERMQESACTDMRGVHFIDGAGHWVQQEQPEETARLLIDFLRDAKTGERLTDRADARQDHRRARSCAALRSRTGVASTRPRPPRRRTGSWEHRVVILAYDHERRSAADGPRRDPVLERGGGGTRGFPCA